MTEIIQAVQAMQDYIEAHIAEKISLTQLAAVAHFSPWYSARIFKKLTSLSPADYIRRLKLSKSALRLRDESIKIIDITFDMGFESVDGYQRAFRREFGCNPKEYAKKPVPLLLFTPYGVKFKRFYTKEKSKMENIQNIQNVFLQVVEKPARKVIVKRGVAAEEYWAYCEEVGCDVWGILTSIKSLGGEPVCLWLTPQYKKANTSTYVQGVEVPVEFAGQVPDGFDVISLPAAKYLMFQGQPFAEEDYCAAIEAVQTSINQYDPSVIGYQWDTQNPRIQLEPIGTRGYIELKAITAV